MNGRGKDRRFIYSPVICLFRLNVLSSDGYFVLGFLNKDMV